MTYDDLADLELPATYPRWLFDDSPIPDPLGHGQRAVDFIHNVLCHHKTGLPIRLDAWVERLVRRIYGPRESDGTRTVRQVVLLVPRGNRKTSISAILGLLHTIGPERVEGGENLFAAADRRQASTAFAEAAGIVRASPALEGKVRLYDAFNSAKKISHNRSHSYLEVVSGDAGTQHGRTPVFGLVDELHVHKNGLLLEAIETGLEKLDEPLLVIATTAGRGQTNVAWDRIEDARKVARGEVDDPSILPVLFEAPRDVDWRDRRWWYAMNPGLRHGYPALSGLERHAARAERSMSQRSSFLQLKLNSWADASGAPFVDMMIYDKGAKPAFEATEFGEDSECWVAADMSVVADLTAVVAAFRRGEDYYVLPHFWLPAEGLQDKADRDGAPYLEWVEQGYLTATEGDVIDHNAVAEYIRNLCATYNVREVAFDPNRANYIMQTLAADGLPITHMQQGWKTQSPALDTLERIIISGRFHHAGNPVLRWNFANIAIKPGENGIRTMSKARSSGRIDGAAATWMAISRAAADETSSWLADPDLDVDAFLADDDEFSLD